MEFLFISLHVTTKDAILTLLWDGVGLGFWHLIYISNDPPFSSLSLLLKSSLLLQSGEKSIWWVLQRSCHSKVSMNKKIFKSVTYLYHDSVRYINRQKYFQKNHLVNLSKNYCFLSASSWKTRIYKYHFRCYVLKVR